MEAVKKSITLEDRSKIKAVHLKFPDILVSADVEYNVKKRHAEILKLESDIADLREEINEKEQCLSQKKKEFKSLMEICDIEFETYTKEITDYKTTLLLKNIGNDIIGHKNS